LSLAIFKVK